MKILYLTHVCWEWIFQRPQILALLLEKDHVCTVVNKKFILRKVATRNNKKPAKMKIAYQLPKGHVFPFINKINEGLYKMTLRDCNKYDAVWVCHPELYEAIPSGYRGMVIYDCMDNHVAMAEPERKDRVFSNEQALIKRADVVFASSEKLREAVPNLDKAQLVRNGFVLNKIYPIKDAQIKECYTIGYFGTVSSWFDFNLLEESLRDVSNIEYRIIGPKEPSVANVQYSDGEKIYFEGVVEHAKLYDHIRDYDALIMPFQVNDIILSVDPVKLYEYICFGKCIISVWYPEIDRFSPYVHFYRNSQEYDALIQELIKTGFAPKYNKQQQEAFLKDNTWEYRYKIINEALQERNKEKMV